MAPAKRVQPHKHPRFSRATASRRALPTRDRLARHKLLHGCSNSTEVLSLLVRVRRNHLFLGLTLPLTTVAVGLVDNTGQFNWTRMTKVIQVNSKAAINDQLLELIEAAQSHALGETQSKAHHGITLRNLIDTGYLSPGTQLVLLGQGGREVTRAQHRESGEIEWQGRHYASPSDKAFASLLARQSLNGWTHWHAELPEGTESLAEIRVRFQKADRDDAPVDPRGDTQSTELTSG